MLLIILTLAVLSLFWETIAPEDTKPPIRVVNATLVVVAWALAVILHQQ